MIIRLKGRADQNTIATADANDVVVTLPVTPAPTEVDISSKDPTQYIYISWTGTAGVAHWERINPRTVMTIGVPTGALVLYLRKMRNRTPDKFLQTQDDVGLSLELTFRKEF